MIGRTSLALFALGSGIEAVFQITAPSLASPEALLLENGFIIALGTWGLLELVKQGKRMATREEMQKLTELVEDRSRKLRDDFSAVILNSETNHVSEINQMRSEHREDIIEVHRRIDGLHPLGRKDQV